MPFPAEFELSSLTGTNGFRINGAGANVNVGFSASNAGDVNGDGFDDVIVGAPNESAAAGASYVVFGKADGFSAEVALSTLDTANGFRIKGEAANDLSGWAVSAAGDVNGDGFDDVIVGAYFDDTNGNHSGASYVVFGKGTGFAADVELSNLDGSDGLEINGVDAYDQSGRAIASAGDVNGDGIGDIIIGANGATPNGVNSGASYVVFGTDLGFAAALNLSDLDGTNGFTIHGEAATDASGCSVSGAGDVNGDGFDDVIIGAYAADGLSGASYVVFGMAGGFTATLELSDLDGSNGFQIDGEGTGDQSGRSVSNAGDVNGDGFADLIVGALLADSNGGESGASYVVFGKASGFAANLDLADLDGTDGFKISGEAAGDQSGTSVSSAGDLNGDGFDDLIVGAAGADPNGYTSGASYIVYGKANGFDDNLDLSALDGNNGFQINGEAEDDFSGWSVSGAGDVNGDGFHDFVIGAHFASPYGYWSGASYVVFGLAPDAAVNWTGAGGGQMFQGGDFDDTIDGAGGNDTIKGGAGNDVLIGGAGADKLIGGAGTRDEARYTGGAVTVDLTDATGASNTGDAQGDTFSGIERFRLSGNADTFTGASGNDVVDGGAGDDTLTGNNGNDFLTGGAGNDQMAGGAGNDTYYVDAGGDQLTEGANAGNDHVLSSVTWTLADDFENLTLTGSNAIDGTGNGANNTIAGNGNANTLTGGGGNDFLRGAGGDDTLDGGEGNDFLDGGTGNDQMSGGAGNDTYYADASGDQATETANAGSDHVLSSVTWTLSDHVENLTLTGAGAIDGTGNGGNNSLTGNGNANTLSGGGGNDFLRDAGGNDTLNGGEGNDFLDGGIGDDQMSGGAGNDTYYADTSGDQTTEAANAGNDHVLSSVTWTLADHVENLTLTGSGAIDGTGNSANNSLRGNGAANTLTGGGGNDVLRGEAGADRFVFTAPSDGRDTVLDFVAGTDKIAISGAGFGVAAIVLHANSAPVASGPGGQFLYDTDDGRLFFDADGQGGAAAVWFATLTGRPALAVGDFELIA